MQGVPAPLKQESSQGGRVMRQEREKSSLKLAKKNSSDCAHYAIPAEKVSSKRIKKK